MRLVKKVLIYMVCQGRLLVFTHPRNRGIGLQVPGGTIERDELTEEAARREFFEETGQTLQAIRFVGEQFHDMRPFKDELHHRTYFAGTWKHESRKRFAHQELHAGRAGVAPEHFSFRWEKIGAGLIDALAVGQGNLLGRLSPTSAKVLTPRVRRAELVSINKLIRTYQSNRASEHLRLLSLLFAEGSSKVSRRVNTTPSRALLAQAFSIAVTGAKKQNNTKIAHAKKILDHSDGNSRRPLICWRKDCAIDSSVKYESTAYVYVGRGSAPSASDDVRACLDEAIAWIRRCNMDDSVNNSLGVIVLLRKRGLLEASNSYTLSGLPGTIFTDFVPSAFRMGEVLLHEATHSWLNDALGACHVSLPRDKLFYSPWRHKDRPAFGIIQAAYVFSRILQYLARALVFDRLAAHEVSYARSRLRSEQRVIKKHLKSICAAFHLISDSRLRDICLEELNRAVNLTHPGEKSCANH